MTSGNYLGGDRDLKVFTHNLYEDLIPPAQSFTLSQEVAGGNEENIEVRVQAKESEDILGESMYVDLLNGTQIISATDPFTRGQLSKLNIGDVIEITGSESDNNQFVVQSISVLGSKTEVTVNITFTGNDHARVFTGTLESTGVNVTGSGTQFATEDVNAGDYLVIGDERRRILTIVSETSLTLEEEFPVNILAGTDVKVRSSSLVTIHRIHTKGWQVLRPVTDYTVGGVGADLNKVLTLTTALAEQDFAYVIHRSEATYQFVPVAGSVGADQLSSNLRSMQSETFSGDGTTTDFTFSTIEDIAGTSLLLVFVDGTFVSDSDYSLTSNNSIISFNSAPATGTDNVYVKNLSFSTVARRSVLSSGQLGAVGAGSVGTDEIINGSINSAKIEDGSITTPKIASDAVTEDEILVGNNTGVEHARSDTGVATPLKIDSDNHTILSSVFGKIIKAFVGAVEVFQLTATGFLPKVAFTLGDASNKFTDLFLSGNITVDGTVDGVDIAALNTQVQGLSGELFQSGDLKSTVVSVVPTGWLECNGQSVATATYPDLFTAIGYTYGGTGGSFNVPDLRGRFLLGLDTADIGGYGIAGTIGESGGDNRHSHIAPEHSHTIAHEHDVPAHGHPYDTTKGSNLVINAGSGNHQHNVAHTHNDIVTVSAGNHNHSLTGGSTVVSGVHSHQIPAYLSNNVDWSNARGTSGGLIRGANITNKYSQVTTGYNSVTDVPFSDGGHSHPLQGNTSTSGNHSHTVRLSLISSTFVGGTSSSNTLASEGGHAHTDTSRFSGTIGNSAVNGNSNFSTNNQSTTTSGDAGNTATSVGGTPAYFTAKVLIKT